jgi:dihydrodipicolinate synthase/N-acetylneuraminate lyase
MEDAQAAGAHAAILTPSYYYPLPEEALFRHFADVSSADVSCPR